MKKKTKENYYENLKMDIQDIKDIKQSKNKMEKEPYNGRRRKAMVENRGENKRKKIQVSTKKIRLFKVGYKGRD